MTERIPSPPDDLVDIIEDKALPLPSVMTDQEISEEDMQKLVRLAEEKARQSPREKVYRLTATDDLTAELASTRAIASKLLQVAKRGRQSTCPCASCSLWLAGVDETIAEAESLGLPSQ